MTETILNDLIEALAELFDGHVRVGILALGSLLQYIDLPETDDRWPKVREAFSQAVKDVLATKDEGVEIQMSVRLAVERQFHHQLRELGLIEKG